MWDDQKIAMGGFLGSTSRPLSDFDPPRTVPFQIAGDGSNV